MNINSAAQARLPVIDLKATGCNITRMRKAAGFTVKDIQAVFGFTNPQAVYKWQSGETLPSIDNLVVLAAVLGTTVDEILVIQ